MGHSGVVRGGFDGRAVVFVGLALVLAVALGALAGSQVGLWAGVLGALAGLIPPAVLAVAIERRARNVARRKRKDEILGKYAPPKPVGGGEGVE
jgi:hypothetical protein